MIIRPIDFETTGLSRTEDDKHAVCEVGVCDLIDCASITEPRSMLTNPGRPIDIEAVAIHHIRDRDVVDAPSPDRAFLKLLVCDPQPDYFAAHNIDHEKTYFTGGSTPWLCTYKTALRIWPKAPGHKLQELRYWLGVDDDEDFERSLATASHRAPDDAYVCAFVLRRIIAEARGGLEKLALWSSGPALLSRVNFGKHAGMYWSEVPVGYLQWIVGQDFDRDVRATAKYYLKVSNSNQGKTDGKDTGDRLL